MKTLSDPERLLGEVLLDEESLADTTLAAVLREVRREQARRVRFKAAGVIVSMLIAVSAGLGVLGPAGRQSRVAEPATPFTSVTIVGSIPLATDMWIESSRSRTPTVESVPDIQVFASRPSGAVRQINDHELFELLDGQPAALVLPADGTSPALVVISEAEQALSIP